MNRAIKIDPAFRYYMHDGVAAFSFELSGTLTGGAAKELETAWRTASSVIGQRGLVIDLTYVAGADAGGRELLRRWHSAGVQFVAQSAWSRSLLESITGKDPQPFLRSANHSTWLPFRMVGLLAITFGVLMAPKQAGAFRVDLYYRLNVFPIDMPPLRERKEDIPLLVEYFIDRYATKAGKKILGIHKPTLERLKSYSWPGNIRELQNVIERSVIVCDTENFTVDESWLSHRPDPTQTPVFKIPPSQEKTTIEAALADARGRVSGPSGAAAKLGLPASTLDSKIRALKIDKHRFKTQL